MIPLPARRRLSRELTRILNTPVADALARLPRSGMARSHRVGVTGPPGAGKSTLIGKLLSGRDPEIRTAVLAIDPTSPISGGSLLGDRVRMEELVGLPNLFLRSIPSRGARNGLCDNVSDLLAVIEAEGFAEIFLETVGVGQAEIDVRSIVDTVILVVPPDSGDSVQAMKAGIIECADIFALTKADDPRAMRTKSDIAAILELRGRRPGSWVPRVIMTADGVRGLDPLAGALAEHRAWMVMAGASVGSTRRRQQAHLQDLFARRIGELFEEVPDIADGPVADGFARLLSRMQPRGPA